MRDGEVMRWQFTVYGYGADLNADNSMYGTASITGEIGDKTQLTYKIAQMREEYKDASDGKTYKSGDDKLESSKIYINVLENILGDPQAKQDALVQPWKIWNLWRQSWKTRISLPASRVPWTPIRCLRR